MRLEYKPEAEKQLKKLPQIEQKKVIRKLNILANDPFAGKPLHGEWQGVYSFRSWPYRIIYTISQGCIIVETIKHRQNAYK